MAHPNTQFAVGDIVRMTPAAFRHLRVFGPQADHWQLVPGFTGIVREVITHDAAELTSRTFVMVEDVVGRIYNCRDHDLVQGDC
jgi:hypothetical protein